MGFVTINKKRFFINDSSGDILPHTPKTYHRNGTDFPHRKSIMYSDGSIEEIEDEDPHRFHWNSEPKKLTGYGVSYSHPRHLNNYHGQNIHSFKDMDKALDEQELLRINDTDEGREINIGNKATPEQLALIKEQFKEHDEPVQAKITSISRKKYDNYNDFYKAYTTHKKEENPDPGNKEFNSHIGKLAEN